MQYRPLGKTGLSVSEIGYGAWGIGGSGWIGAQEDESVRALHRAIELGVNFIDTARGYGESERIVGAVVREHRGDRLYVATKVPPKKLLRKSPSGNVVSGVIRPVRPPSSRATRTMTPTPCSAQAGSRCSSGAWWNAL